MYLGRAPKHAGDVYQFLNLATNRVIVSRDAIWLKKVYGDYKELSTPRLTELVT